MKLDIPLIQQREDSFHCQVAALLMTLRHFGDTMDYDELLSELQPYVLDTGMHSQGIMIYLRKRGYNTVFRHHDLGVVSLATENLTEKDLVIFKKEYEEVPDDEKNKYRKTKLALDIEYMELGGLYSNVLPKLDLIKEYIEKGIPVTLGVKNKGIRLRPVADEGNHAIVITGYDDNSFFVNDPAPKSDGQYQLSYDRLLHAWYSTGVQTKIAWR